MRDAPTNHDDIIDSRDVISRIEELEALKADAEAAKAEQRFDVEFSEEDASELKALQDLANEAEGYAPDWRHGATLVRDSYFEDYAQEMLEDCGDIPKDIPHYVVIDWEATARNIRFDYTSVDFDGVTYWVC